MTVEVAGTETRPVAVTVMLAETPTRPPILGAIPGGVSTVADPGRSLSPSFAVAEVGYQEAVEALDADLGGLTNGAGTQLPGTATATVSADSLAAGEREPADLSVEIDDEPDLAGESTRFTGQFTCSGDEASVTATVSVLVLDTGIEGARLVDADRAVTATRATVGELPEEEPPGEVIDVYEVNVGSDNEEATASVRLPEPLGDTGLSAFWLADGSYERADYLGGTEGSTVEVPTGEHDLVVVEFPGPPPLPGFDDPPQDLDGDGRFEDIDGDGEFDIFDVQALFNNLDSDAVQNHPEAFNFSENDPEEVDILDVQALFDRLTNRDE